MSQSREFIAERDLRIFQAARNGNSRAVIAKQFGISTSAVGAAIKRQLDRLNREALTAAPDLIRLELERLDTLMAGIWPFTQPQRITIDGKDEILPPDPKYVTEARNIIKDRVKLLGLEQTQVNVTVDAEPMKAALAGAAKADELNEHDPRTQALKMLEIMGATGILDRSVIDQLMGTETAAPVEVEPPKELESGIKPLAQILEELGPEEETTDA